MSDFVYTYKVGMRVGLLARVTDVHDKGNIVLKIDGTEQYVHVSEADLLAGTDLIYQKLREKAEADAQAAADAEAAAQQNEFQAAAKKPVKTEEPKPEPKSYVPVSQPDEKKDVQGGA